MKITRLIAILIVLILTSKAYSKDALRMGFVEFFPAYYIGNNGKIQGTMIDMMKDISSITNYKITYSKLPFNRLLNDLRVGDVDIWVGLKDHPVLNEVAHIGDEPIRSIKLTAYSLTSKPTISGIEDIKKHRVILVKSYNYGKWGTMIRDPKNRIDYFDVASHAAAVRVLKSGRGDLLFHYPNAIRPYLKTIDQSRIRTQLISEEVGYIAISKKTKNAKKILKLFEDALRTLKKKEPKKYLDWENKKAF